MTNEEIRIKIAESLRWTFHDIKYAHIGGGAVFEKFWLPPGIDIEALSADDISSGPSHGRSLPNYPESLDACAEFEATLTSDELVDYSEELPSSRIAAITADPRTRCLAYLKTKGLIP